METRVSADSHNFFCLVDFVQTKGEKPEFLVEVINIQAVEEVDDSAFGQALCFQVSLLTIAC